MVVEPGAIATEFGSVLEQPMLDRSGAGPYAPMARSVAQATKATYEKGQASPASVVARAVSRAISVRRPKTRYAVGMFAKPLLFMRHWLNDRAFDAIIKRATGVRD